VGPKLYTHPVDQDGTRCESRLCLSRHTLGKFDLELVRARGRILEKVMENLCDAPDLEFSGIGESIDAFPPCCLEDLPSGLLAVKMLVVLPSHKKEDRGLWIQGPGDGVQNAIDMYLGSRRSWSRRWPPGCRVWSA